MAWTIILSEAARKSLRKLDRQVAARILSFLEDRLAALEDPRSIGEALVGPRLGDHWKYRVGDHRIIATIRDRTVTIIVVRIGHRSDIYRR